MKNINLKSSVNKTEKSVTRRIQFSSGNSQTWSNMEPEIMIDGKFFKMWCSNGKRVMIHTKNVDWIEEEDVEHKEYKEYEDEEDDYEDYDDKNGEEEDDDDEECLEEISAYTPTPKEENYLRNRKQIENEESNSQPF